MANTKYILTVKFDTSGRTYDYYCTQGQYKEFTSNSTATGKDTQAVVDVSGEYKLVTIIRGTTSQYILNTKATENIVSIIDDVDYVQSSTEYLKKENKRLKEELKELKDFLHYRSYTGGSFQNFPRGFF